MLPLLAELETDARPANERGAARRILRLEVQASSSEDSTRALIRNLSERGLLIETTADLTVGEVLHVDLPEAGPSAARVVWTEGSFFGCEFTNPVSKAAVSAALLLAPVEPIQPVSAVPQMATSAVFGDGQAQPEPTPEIESLTIRIVLMASLILMLLSVALFVFALLALPISML